MSEWIISSSALIVAMVLLRRVMRGKISLRLQYALWLIVLVRLLLPLSFGEARVSVQNVVREADAKLTSQVLTYVNYETPDLYIPEPVQNLGEAERQAQYEQNLAEYEAQIEAAKASGADCIELHTGAFANAVGEAQKKELERLIKGAEFAHSLGLTVNAGHGIDYENIQLMLKVPYLHELNIGYSIICRAIFTGLKHAVQEMLSNLNAYGKNGEN